MNMNTDFNMNRPIDESLLLEQPWQKIRFKTYEGTIQEGYVYAGVIASSWMYVSQNKTPETIGLAQNWVIAPHQIIEYL